MNDQNFRKIFMAYFIVFGIVISLFGTLVSYQIQTINTEMRLDETAEEILQIKLKNILQPFLKHTENIVVSLVESQPLQRYIDKEDESDLSVLEEIFLAVAVTDKQIMHLRFLDKNGVEKVRVDRNSQNEAPFIVKKENLQDKSGRDYFKEVLALNEQDVWHSKIDLNIENKEVEVPYKPTLRVAKPVFKNGEFAGVIIANILISTLMEQISTSSTFHHYIVDKDGYFILHPEKRYSWNRYTGISRSLAEDFPTNSALILQEKVKNKNFFTFSLESLFKNDDGAIFVLKPKEDYQEKLIKEKIIASIIVVFLSILLSILMALYASKKPSKLQKSLFLAHKKLTQFGKIIDEYVITATTRKDTVITDASSAFSEISGYSKEELIGKKMNIIKAPDTPDKTYKQMWEKLNNKQDWSGEMKNRAKNGEIYWIDENIIPVLNEKNEVTSYMAVSIDITTKKEIEQISITDGLTNIFNRRHFNDTFPKVINSAKRNNDLVCFLMLDIDHFKPYNDNYGHQAGDDVLIKFSACLKESVHRADDMVFRLGGEEFGIIYKSESKEKALEFANKVCQNIENLKIPHEYNSASAYITASMGLVCKNASEIKDMDEVFKEADDLLYEAKDSGRNQVRGNA